ncbi:hypothetical protein RHOSPDRAFT_33555 [Rhodotorula sp. JG-1b]|nr:hypothetical protein RHOSPDRAFT_33555 [Rhodotorula sp. JG-1b]
MPAVDTTRSDDDVNVREARLEALVNVLGFADLDDLENFVFLHGSVKVVPVTQRDTLPLDETQTQASEEQHMRRRLARLRENAQLKTDLERAKADLDWHKLELQRERARGETLAQDKVRLLDALAAEAPGSLEADGGGSLPAPSRSDELASPRVEPARLSQASEGRATDEPQNTVGNAVADRSPEQASDRSPRGDGTVSTGAPGEGSSAFGRVNAADSRDPVTLSAPRKTPEEVHTRLRTGRETRDAPPEGIVNVDRQSERLVPTPGVANGALEQTALTPTRTPRPNAATSSGRLGDDPFASTLRKISLYPKLWTKRREFREAVREAQERLSQLEGRLLVATDTIRSAVLASFGPAPSRLDLDVFPDTPELPVEADRRLAYVRSVDFEALYHALHDQEQKLSRQDALVRRWIASVENLLAEVTTAMPRAGPASLQDFRTPEPSGLGAIRKRRRVTGQSIAGTPAGRRTTATADESSPAPIGPIAARTSITPVSTACFVLQAADRPQAGPSQYRLRPSDAHDVAMKDASSLSARNAAQVEVGGPLEQIGAAAFSSPNSRRTPSRRASLDENGSPSASDARGPTRDALQPTSAQVTPPRGALPRESNASDAAIHTRVKSEASPVADTANRHNDDSAPRSDTRPEAKLTSLPAARISLSPVDAWFDLDAPTPPAVDEETRKKLKTRNQLKRKRRRAGARNMEERLQDSGRHRVNQPSETAPLDYWQFGFPSTQAVENFNARARARNAKK